ncbi:type VI secretion system tip protein VgrG [Pseudomonas protegens]|jgi:type VI secretion system secreted protein VgrG|uniref:Type VI secretion protein VgrG n=4 Tax=Pseudomonas protegens TaxID=380021 RepID=Q4K3N1_PSEF5|nr:MULTISPECIES: type VI secretion system tip protein VgrG [Pseudomonas]7Q5P_A Chain A, Type VI secretion protein VgrG [Pseudomonas protegens Pf-5]7Q5P_B Chain B, Type VI secretion protein VgrG [Pseudomonas protegens Pf-5]7Q5P_C Chain C, Type VI secretion protein VgrG [Pseudomonas protegens Pf-5]AAY95282.1 type VI secretion protein VgrG [Pseudomonas protegens Pf-5]AGL87781.1 Rhs-family protein [Pseudomonas protegens CHA0]ASE20573.1 type VI secretion system tip protein VgrG [Pseudomonas proteg
MLFQQSTRLAQVNCPLGPDVLLLKSLGGGEELGRLFDYQLQLASSDANIDLNQLLGKPMGLSVQLDGGGQRYFHGIVARCSQNIDTGQFASYEVTLRPWLWLLSRTSDCRIFQNLSIPQIIKQVFRDLGFSDFEDALSRPYREWEYCVQYRETSFDFVSRLMEQEGIYYFFRHEKDRHVVVLADAYGAHSSVPGYASVPYYPRDEQQRERDHMFDWHLAQEVQPGSLELNDYDFQRPSARIDVRSAMPRPHSAGDYPLYDYPGTYVQSSDGEHYAQTRIEALQSLHERIELSGNARGLGVGNLFSLTGFSRQDQNREYLIVSIRYYLVQESLESGAGGGSAQFESHLTCIDAQQSFRPLATTHKPMVQGPQTARVVGPAGEEIWTDQYGRVKVHFHWDRHDQSNENSSCWIRVSQAWAGKNWGSMQIPRIGQEVIVSFLEGDPDRPIITGRVYNAEQTVPYDLPANATQSGMKSRSSKGGSPANFNEIRMEDKKGAEQLYIHAERNQDIVVEVNESHSVGNNRNKSIGHDEYVTIGNKRTRIVQHVDELRVGEKKLDSVGQSYVIEVGERLRLVCGASILELNASGQINLCGVNISVHASADAQINTGGVLHLNNGGGPGTTTEGQGVQGAISAKAKAPFSAPKG